MSEKHVVDLLLVKKAVFKECKKVSPAKVLARVVSYAFTDMDNSQLRDFVLTGMNPMPVVPEPEDSPAVAEDPIDLRQLILDAGGPDKVEVIFANPFQSA